MLVFFKKSGQTKGFSMVKNLYFCKYSHTAVVNAIYPYMGKYYLYFII